MSIEKSFNPATHREEYDKTEQELGKVKADISGEKTKEEIDSLVAERDRLVVELDELKGAAQEQAEEDNVALDFKRGRIQTHTTVIEGHKQRIEELTKEIEEITGKKIQQEQEQPDIETIKQSLQPFLFETFKIWYSEDSANKAKQEARLEKPEKLSYKALSEDINEQKFGEYTLNPDVQNIDFEKARVFIPDLSQFVGEKRYEVMEYVAATYGATHHIPGIEYWKWVIENQDKAPQVFKDVTKWFHFAGSVLRGRDGHWHTPYVNWDGGEFGRDAPWLDNACRSDARVALLEKEKQDEKE